MPWLIREEDAAKNGGKPFLFVHTPRCGGTSLTKLYNVPAQARAGRDPWHKLGMIYFFYRYKLLETQNFPLLTWENLFVAFQLCISLLVWIFNLAPSIDPSCETGGDYGELSLKLCPPPVVSIVMWVTSTMTFTCSTFLFTASVSGRVDWMRKLYEIIVGWIMFDFTYSEKFLTGVSRKGYVVHYTAAKMVKYGHVTKEQFTDGTVDNFTVVRNPFSRMVSIYMYNRYGPLESFEHFCLNWKKKWDAYQASGSTDEWDVYCHVLPQFEYTHLDGNQLVAGVIRQEDLKKIVRGELDECIANGKKAPIAPQVLSALKNMPHSNRRRRDKPWQDYYNARTIKLVREMYAMDFALFGYSTDIPGRPELDMYIKTSSVPVKGPDAQTSNAENNAEFEVIVDDVSAAEEQHSDSASDTDASSDSSVRGSGSFSSLSEQDLLTVV